MTSMLDKEIFHKRRNIDIMCDNGLLHTFRFVLSRGSKTRSYFKRQAWQSEEETSWHLKSQNHQNSHNEDPWSLARKSQSQTVASHIPSHIEIKMQHCIVVPPKKRQMRNRKSWTLRNFGTLNTEHQLTQQQQQSHPHNNKLGVLQNTNNHNIDTLLVQVLTWDVIKKRV